jgi:hypothetical protein
MVIFCEEFSPNQLKHPDNTDKITVAPFRKAQLSLHRLSKKFSNLNGIVYVLNFTDISVDY